MSICHLKVAAFYMANQHFHSITRGHIFKAISGICRPDQESIMV